MFDFCKQILLIYNCIYLTVDVCGNCKIISLFFYNSIVSNIFVRTFLFISTLIFIIIFIKNIVFAVVFENFYNYDHKYQRLCLSFVNYI